MVFFELLYVGNQYMVTKITLCCNPSIHKQLEKEFHLTKAESNSKLPSVTVCVSFLLQTE